MRRSRWRYALERAAPPVPHMVVDGKFGVRQVAAAYFEVLHRTLAVFMVFEKIY